jgi:hypothetical protein
MGKPKELVPVAENKTPVKEITEAEWIELMRAQIEEKEEKSEKVFLPFSAYMVLKNGTAAYEDRLVEEYSPFLKPSDDETLMSPDEFIRKLIDKFKERGIWVVDLDPFIDYFLYFCRKNNVVNVTEEMLDQVVAETKEKLQAEADE